MHNHIKVRCLLLLALCASVSSCDKLRARNDKVTTPSPAAPVNKDLEGQSVRGVCTLKPLRVVRLKAQVGGRVKTVNSERGTWVKSDVVMATIDVTDLELRKERIRLELERLKARADLLAFQITRAEKEFSVIQSLAGVESTYLPRFGKEMATLSERRADLKDNEINQSLNKLDIKAVDEQIRKSTILAPFEGVVLSRAVEPGMVIGSGIDGQAGGDVLFEVADPRHLIAECLVKEADALGAEAGKLVSLVPDGIEGESIEGKISHLSPVITNVGGVARREFHVEISPVRRNTLLPGMNAEVIIPYRAR